MTRDFEAIANAIRTAVSEISAPVQAALDPLGQINKLAELLAAGHVTQAEYDVKKADLLARM